MMLYPHPQMLTEQTGSYAVKGNYENLSLLDFYKKVKEGNEDVTVTLSAVLKKEEYLLSVKPEGITITAAGDEGIYRAATTLQQLICGEEAVSCVEIHDWPQFDNRGYMYMNANCNRPTKETVKQIVDFLSGLKYNQLQLYMEHDAFTYAAYPKYTADFACFTPEDIRELDAYCKERFVDLVPNQNSFGHMYGWLKKDEFFHLGLHEEGKYGGTINPLLDESYEMVSNLYESLLPHFESEYVNIGFDEAYGLGKFQSEEYCNKYGKDTLYMEWLNKLSSLIDEKYGKKVMFWADMFYKYDRLYSQTPKGAIALEWGYELIQSQVMTDHCITFQNAGLDYYVCPSINTHMSFTGRFDVTSFNIRTTAEIGAKYGAKGYLLTDWGGESFPVWGIVPAALAGQYAWNVGVEQDGETFKAEYIRDAEKFIDQTIFGGAKVSNLLYRIANYYLLEPERVHVGSICGEMFRMPLEQTKYAYFYDLKDISDDFYFDNVIDYVKRVLEQIKAQDFNEQLKRDIIANSESVILAAELCKLKTAASVSNEKIDELITMLDKQIAEYTELWGNYNFPKGVELVLENFNDRRADLLALKA